MIAINKFIEWIVEKLERRKSISELTKDEDLILSNASLEDIKRGINKIYNEVYGAVDNEKGKMK